MIEQMKRQMVSKDERNETKSRSRAMQLKSVKEKRRSVKKKSNSLKLDIKAGEWLVNSIRFL